MLDPGRDCWWVGRANVGALIDSEEYFASLYENLVRARRNVLLLGWDIYSRQELVPEKDAIDGWPTRLGPLLDALARERPELEIRILVWDYSSLFAFGRESFQTWKLGWQTHERVKFRFDSEHPLYASHHQKVVVIDDAIAYTGGIDVTHHRWDTVQHEPHDPRRERPQGGCYAPIHDVQAVVDGEAAARLGELCRERWRRATGESVPMTPPSLQMSDAFALPEEVLVGAKVALARTVPRFKNVREIREVERLFVRMIDDARHCLYVENQYFTSAVAVGSLKRSVARREGPEIVLILPKKQDNWLSERTMGSLSSQAIEAVRAADRYGRFDVFYPEDSRLEKGYVNVHSKVMAVDGRWLRIGSANLNNRSMGLDTECDLIVDAGGDRRHATQISRVVSRLLGHHLGLDASATQRERDAGRSMRELIAAHREDGPKSLEPFAAARALTPIDVAFSSCVISDPEAPLDVERALDEFIFRGEVAEGIPPGRLFPAGAGMSLAFCVVAIAARGALASAAGLPEWGDAGAVASVGILGAFVALGSLGVPMQALAAISAVMLPAPSALALSWLGSVGIAATDYAIGRGLGAGVARRSVPAVYLRLQRRAGSELVAFVVLRLFPIAPFAATSLAAGHLRAAPGPYFVGTSLGILPWLVAIVAFVRTLEAVARHPGLLNVLAFAAVALCIGVVFAAAARRVARAPLARVRAVEGA